MRDYGIGILSTEHKVPTVASGLAMASDISTSIIGVGNLTKPADTLVKKVSNAVGGLFAPHQIERIAKADARAALIKAQSDIEVTDLHRRAVRRWIEEEAQSQENMEAIVSKALPKLNEDANADSVEDDWIVNFFDKGRIVSDREMQELWSRILAGEANSPGSYSKRTVNFLSDFEKSEADLFAKLCGFIWMFGQPIPLILDTEAEIYERQRITFSSLSHLESIGLIRFDALVGFRRTALRKAVTTHYFGRPLRLNMPNDADNEVSVGHALLTNIGQQLVPICGAKPVDGFWDYVNEKWGNYLRQPDAG